MRAKIRGSGVEMLHVIEPADFQSLSAVAERMKEEQQREAEALMQELAALAYRDSGILPGSIIRSGQVGEEIINATKENPDISMLVLGVAHESSGRGKLSNFLISQLGVKLLLPVLMVPGNLTDQQLAQLV